MSSILKSTRRKKEELLQRIERELFSSEYPSARSISVRKKIVTYENLLRFYQNSIVTFALEDHTHYAADILTDAEHKFVNDKQIELIEKFGETTIATTEQIKELFV
jgi:hypothetical protein